MMSSVGQKNAETIRRQWAIRIESDILSKQSRMKTQLGLEEHREYREDRISMMMLLQRKFYAAWWHEFASRYPGVMLLIVLLSCVIGVLLALR